ncbi:hypothetical protein MRX96_031204 [Rhipicephalus microplus]
MFPSRQARRAGRRMLSGTGGGCQPWLRPSESGLLRASSSAFILGPAVVAWKVAPPRGSRITHGSPAFSR